MATTSHFFTESGGFTQSPAQSFGPVNDTEFNLTSKFSVATPQKAYSICKGVVLVQPQTADPTKVNLILRPYKQPFKGLNVKYFIYRGLQRSDFFTTDGDPLIKSSSTGTPSDFITKINIDFDAFHGGRKEADGTPIAPPPFTAKYIGYDESITDLTIPLSSFFFKESEFVAADNAFDEKDDFELPMIDVGQSLGNFAQGVCGIDVVLNYGDYKHNFDNGEFVFNLEYARNTEAKIVLSGTDVEKKLLREQIIQFIDIVAFYGLYSNEGNVSITNSLNEINFKIGISIYNEVMLPFFNKNKVYLYIQSDLKRSYNFYNNYKFSSSNNNNFKFGIEDSLIESGYGYLGWPVHIFEAEQHNSDKYNDISIQLITSLSYEETALYVPLGIGNFKNGFITRNNIIDSQNINQNINFSKTITFKVPNIDVNGNKKNISSIINIIYLGKKIEYSFLSSNSLWDDRKRYSLYNNIFPNLDILSNFTIEKNLSIITLNKYALINYNGFSNYMNESLLQGYVAFLEGTKNVIQSDLTNQLFIKEKVLFISKKIETLDNFSIHEPIILSRTINSSNMSINLNTQEQSNYFTTLYCSNDYSLTHNIITENNVDVKLLSLNIGTNIDYCFYNLGITKTELNNLKELVPDKATNINIYINDDLKNPRVDANSASSYFKYSLGISFENNNGELSALLPTSPLYVYGLSNRFLASAEYSDFEEKSLLDNKITILKEIEI